MFFSLTSLLYILSVFDLYLYSAYAAHCVYFNFGSFTFGSFTAATLCLISRSFVRHEMVSNLFPFLKSISKLALRLFNIIMVFSLTKGQCSKRQTILSVLAVPGVDLGFFVTSFRALQARKSRAKGARFLGGSGGMPRLEILKSSVSEMPFPALWGKIQRESDGQKTTNIHV